MDKTGENCEVVLLQVDSPNFFKRRRLEPLRVSNYEHTVSLSSWSLRCLGGIGNTN